MEKNKKLTISLSVLDIAKMDILIDNLFYSNRSEFIREAVRKQLLSHDEDVQNLYARKLGVCPTDTKKDLGGIGVVSLKYEDLIRAINNNVLVDIVVIGILWVDSKITLDLIKKSVDNITVYGSVKSSKEIRDYITYRGMHHER